MCGFGCWENTGCLFPSEFRLCNFCVAQQLAPDCGANPISRVGSLALPSSSRQR